MDTTAIPQTIPEDQEADLPRSIPLIQDDFALNNEELFRRREQRRRTKQWSDGVLLMAHPPQDLAELQSSFHPRPLRRRGSRTESVMELGIPTNQAVDQHVKEEHGENSWRYKAMEVLHNKKVQFFFMALLILDVFILFTEVTLLAMFPFCDIIKRDAISCVPDNNHTNNISDHRWLAGGDDHYNDICASDDGMSYAVQPEYPVGCDDHKWHTVHAVEKALFIMTMIILSCFFVELNTLMVVLKPNIFFRQLFYLMDYLIIGISLGLELFFYLAHEELTSSLVGLLVIFRSWRYVRISHGIMEVTAELADQKFNRLLNYTEHLEQIIREQGLELPQNSKVDKLRQNQEVELVTQIRRHHAEEKRLQKLQGEETAAGSDTTTGTTNGSS